MTAQRDGVPQPRQHGGALRQVEQQQARVDEVVVARGVEEGAFAPPAAIGDFTLRFVAVLDGLSLQRLQQMRHASRKRLTELAMHTARTELAPDPGRPAG